MEITNALELLARRKNSLLRQLEAIKLRKMIQRDWREEIIHKMEIIDIKKELELISLVKQ